MKYKREKTKVSKYISRTNNIADFSRKSGFKKRVRISLVIVTLMFSLSGFGIVKRPVIKSIFGHSWDLKNVFSVKTLEKSKFLKTAGEGIFDFCFGYLKKSESSKTGAYDVSAHDNVSSSSAETCVQTDFSDEVSADSAAYRESENAFEPIWPCVGEISSEYGERIHPISGESKFHGGIDIAVSEGTPIAACEDGKVTVAAFNEYSGNHVIITHNDGYTSSYSHMSGLNVSEGTQIKKGDIVGYAGSTGIATGPHLHFEIKYDGTGIDPAAFLDNVIG